MEIVSLLSALFSKRMDHECSFNEGVTYFRKGQYAQAEIAFRESLARNKSEDAYQNEQLAARTYLWLAKTHLEYSVTQGLYARDVARIDDFLQRAEQGNDPPTTVRVWVTRGTMHWQQRNVGMAVSDYECARQLAANVPMPDDEKSSLAKELESLEGLLGGYVS